MGNAQTESDGSAKLLDLWRSVDFNRDVEDKLLFHATDEARHSRLFVKLADTISPGMFVGDFLHRMRSSLAKIDRNRLVKFDSPIDEALLIDHLVQMNMGEIRTRLHMVMLAPVMNAFAPEDARPELQQTLNGLAHDEIVHIGYIANILETWSENGDEDRIKRMYTGRLMDFHQFTFYQTEPAVRSFGQGKFPELLEIWMTHMQEIEIRKVVESELPQAFAVLRELREHLDFLTFSARLKRQSEHGYCLYGAYQGGVLVGLIGMRPVETMARGKHLHVDDLVVTASRRGEGIGKELLAFAEQHASNEEFTSVFLDSRQEVLGFYRELGYSPHTATLMRKKLQ